MCYAYSGKEDTFMFNTENLLRNEVFPAELPPCFSTDDLAANATLAIATSNSFGQGYVKVFDISISQAYITKVLKTTNELAIIIMLDIVHSSGQENVAAILQQRKNLHNYLKSEDTNEKGSPNSLMWTSHWLLAYESTKNQWLKLPGIPFEYAKKNSFFNELLNRNVKFYNPGFSYSNPPNKFHNPEFATRSELYNALRKMKKSILEQLEGAGLETPSSLTPEEEDLFSKFIEALQADETIY